MTFSTVSVDYHNPHWRVRVSGEAVDRSQHRTSDEAAAAGRELARHWQAELVICDRGGRVVERTTYRTGSL
jgi:hypothetical protein